MLPTVLPTNQATDLAAQGAEQSREQPVVIQHYTGQTAEQLPEAATITVASKPTPAAKPPELPSISLIAEARS